MRRFRTQPRELPLLLDAKMSFPWVYRIFAVVGIGLCIYQVKRSPFRVNFFPGWVQKSLFLFQSVSLLFNFTTTVRSSKSASAVSSSTPPPRTSSSSSRPTCLPWGSPSAPPLAPSRPATPAPWPTWASPPTTSTSVGGPSRKLIGLVTMTQSLLSRSMMKFSTMTSSKRPE